MITKGERYREIVAALARHGIGVVDDQFVKHEASDHARAQDLRRACELNTELLVARIDDS